MKFDQIHNDTDCKCINNTCQENTSDIFCRALKGKDLTASDFMSYWEEGRRLPAHIKANCEDTCERKGISINLLNSDNEENVKGKFSSIVTRNIKPQRKIFTHYCKFKFAADCGKLKHTPGRGDQYHYTFYKCDGFNIKQLEHVSILPLS